MRKIRVFIQTDKFEGGPAVFRSRIIKALKQFEDIEIVTDVNKKFDIELAFIRRVYYHKKPYILRVDGCYYMEGQTSNKAIIDAINNARYIIFQSQFAEKLCSHVLPISFSSCRKSIIYNGVNLKWIKSIKPNKKIEPGSFVACGHWRPNKRPNSTMKGFGKAKTGRNLYMIGGQAPPWLQGEKIDYKYNLGSLSPEKTISVLKACDYLIHLCHIDSCPNVVIEALVCGLNVLCTNLGGTRELVGNDGVVLNVDKPLKSWKGSRLPKTKLDNVNSRTVANGVKELMSLRTKPDRAKDFDINNVAEKYADIIRNNV